MVGVVVVVVVVVVAVGVVGVFVIVVGSRPSWSSSLVSVEKCV
jgi:hypothetical protein